MTALAKGSGTLSIQKCPKKMHILGMWNYNCPTFWIVPYMWLLNWICYQWGWNVIKCIEKNKTQRYLAVYSWWHYFSTFDDISAPLVANSVEKPHIGYSYGHFSMERSPDPSSLEDRIISHMTNCWGLFDKDFRQNTPKRHCELISKPSHLRNIWRYFD